MHVLCLCSVSPQASYRKGGHISCGEQGVQWAGVWLPLGERGGRAKKCDGHACVGWTGGGPAERSQADRVSVCVCACVCSCVCVRVCVFVCMLHVRV